MVFSWAIVQLASAGTAAARASNEVRGIYLGGVRNSGSLLARAAPETAPGVHAIVDVENKLRGRAGDAGTVRNVVERPAQFGMVRDVAFDFIEALAGGPQGLFELGLGLHLGLAQSHLYAAVRVDLPFAGGFDGKENHVLEFVDYGRLYTVRLRRRHAAKRLQRENHVAEAVDCVVHVLANFEMTFTATPELVVGRMCHLR